VDSARIPSAASRKGHSDAETVHIGQKHI